MSLQDERNCDGTEFETVFAETGSIVEAVGYTFTPAVSSAGVISWTNDGGLPNPDPVNIKGANGDDGQDGFSPEVSVETITGGHEVTITDAEGDHTFDVMDGEKGETGEQGEKGDTGDDGFSPTVEVTEITGGHRVTITDSEEAHVFDVMDGQSGGTGVHNDLTGRDTADAHPMSAITGLVTALAGKQDTISDLATIRSGAALGATALQAVPNTYRTAAAQDVIDNGKQDKSIGAQYAGDFLVVGIDGNITHQTLSVWEGGDY